MGHEYGFRSEMTSEDVQEQTLITLGCLLVG